MPATSEDDQAKRHRLGLAAAQGDADAQRDLGVMHRDGDGGPVDFAEAKRLFGLAAAQGNAHSQFFLGVMHHECGLPAEAHSQLQKLRIWRNASDHPYDGQWQSKGPPSEQAASEHLAALWGTVDRLCSRQAGA